MLNMISKLFFSIAVSAFLFTFGCSAQQSEEQALQSLRQLTRSGKLPPESVVSGIESRFANQTTGALAKLLRARIRFDSGDFTGAAAILDSNVFESRTKVADHALWLRGRSLQSAGRHAEALSVFDELVKKYPDFVHSGWARKAWGESALASGRAVDVPGFLVELSEAHEPGALLMTAKAYEAQGSRTEAVRYYRRAYFYGAGSAAAKEAEAKLTSMGEILVPQNGEEQLARADALFAANKYADAAASFNDLTSRFPAEATRMVQVKRIAALSQSGKMADSQGILISLPASDQAEAYRQIALGYAKARNWSMARNTVDQFRQKHADSPLVPKTMMDVGLAARAAKYRADDTYYFNGVVASYPKAVEVAGAQFEMAWSHHENKNFALAAQMLTEHLERYVDKDTTNRGKAGYWAARNSERAGKVAEACALYDAVIYRYAANWYGYIANDRLASMKKQGRCSSATPPSSQIAKAVANLKVVTVAAETSTAKELERAEKSEELSTVGLFDWAIDELQEAKKTAVNSPKINLALAKHYRLKGDNVNALLALAKSYPDYAQMFPEEMGREEWDIFYPLTNWEEIKFWGRERRLEPYLIAGLIRQESVFNPIARSHANAYGLMQLLVPTAQSMARKYVSNTLIVTASALYQPPLNIELGTAYMRDQLDKFGRVEFMAVAYNAGPGRVPQWQRTLPAEMDEFVEEIPFRETKGYVQGVIRNSAQYRRLYEEDGSFKANVGSRPLRGEIDSKPREQFAAEYPDVLIDAAGE
ncbi:hypothetical protein BH20ACI2_BH20ACI2_21800 [soil metagenome]